MMKRVQFLSGSAQWAAAFRQRVLSCLLVSAFLMILGSQSVFSADSQSIRATFEEIVAQIPADHFLPVRFITPLYEHYTDEELVRIYDDLKELEEKTFSEAEHKKEYLATAGGPSSGKSTLLDQLVLGKKYAYIDPDKTCLQRMRRTYLADRAAGMDCGSAYNYWRDASNFLCNVFLSKALKEGYKIAHGSTMTSPHAARVLASIRQQGYFVHLAHVTCDDELRLLSERARRQSGMIQCTNEDFRNKGLLFFSRLPDYVQNTDMITFYYRKAMAKMVESAKKKCGGPLEIIDIEAIQAIKSLHDRKRAPGYWDQCMHMCVN